MGRNPRECAVAKTARISTIDAAGDVATRANALWQNEFAKLFLSPSVVATRANALWQKCLCLLYTLLQIVATRANALWQNIQSILVTKGIDRRNPRECAVAKWLRKRQTRSELVATRANALWQR